jgi:hypothetical protein
MAGQGHIRQGRVCRKCGGTERNANDRTDVDAGELVTVTSFQLFPIRELASRPSGRLSAVWVLGQAAPKQWTCCRLTPPNRVRSKP